MKAHIDIDDDGRITVDGQPVETWIRINVRTPFTDKSATHACEHAPMDDPRFTNVCRKCGRVI